MAGTCPAIFAPVVAPAVGTVPIDFSSSKGQLPLNARNFDPATVPAAPKNNTCKVLIGTTNHAVGAITPKTG